MRFQIDDVIYTPTQVLDELDASDTLAMAKQAGMGLQTWGRVLAQIERLALADDGETVIVLSESDAKATPERVDQDLLFDSERHQRALLILFWLTRRVQGERSLSFEQSLTTPWRRLQILPDEPEPEPEDEDQSPDPQPPSASAPAGSDATATSTPSSPDSTTPSSTSTATSST